MDEKTLLWITAMINNFPQSKNTDMKLALFGFEAVLEGLSNAAIVDTAKAYMGGRIQGQDLAFAPSSAQFAVEARKRDWELRPKPIMIEAPVEREPEFVVSPEERARVNAKIDQWRKENMGSIAGEIFNDANEEKPEPILYEGDGQIYASENLLKSKAMRP